MLRCSADDVLAMVEQGKDPDGNNIPPEPFIHKASLIVDRAVTCAAGRGKAISTDEQKEIETLLAAHFYTLRVPRLASKGTQSASGAWQLDSLLDMAYALDPSGCLKSIMERKVAGVAWLGKKKSEQTVYEDRD